MNQHRIPPVSITLAAVLTLTAACRNAEAPSADGAATEVPAEVVDSVLPMDVMLQRFRTGLPEPERLTGGADSRDGLVEGLVRALQESDTLAFERFSMGMSEWAWLYYGTAAQAQPPYELPPGMAWLQFQETNRTGALRALERLGGHALVYRGHVCDPAPTLEGGNRIWIGCTVTLGVDGAPPAPVRLFSSILERDGRWVVLSYANDF
jgi:hypothetical protein